jgi:hypothetical protein
VDASGKPDTSARPSSESSEASNTNGGVTIRVDKTSIQSGDMVKVTVENDNPTADDWVGAYSPGIDVDVSRTSPVKYAKLSGPGPRDIARYNSRFDYDSGYTKSGVSEVSFKLNSIRVEEYVFIVFNKDVNIPRRQEWSQDPEDFEFTGIDESWVLVRSPPVRISNFESPMQVRVLPSPTLSDPNRMRFMWTSGSGYNTPQMQWSYSKEGESLTGNVQTVMAETVTYSRADLCGSPANTTGYRDAGPLHEALVGGLRYGTKVYYSVSGASSPESSDIYTFRVPPEVGPNSSTNLAVWGDMGLAKYGEAYSWFDMPGAALVMSQINLANDLEQFDLAFCNGDINYAMGRASVWDDYLVQIENVASSVPFVQTHGNHEMDVPFTYDYKKSHVPPGIYDGNSSGGECGVPSLKRLHGPWERDSTNREMPYWSYNIGNVHMVGIGTEVDYSTGSEQLVWLENDLANVDRSVTPWVIVGGHRPGLIDSGYGPDCVTRCAYTPEVMTLTQFVEPLLVKYGVDIVLWAHSHDYQRQCAAYKFQCVQRSRYVDALDSFVQFDPPAPIHFSIGSAGAGYTPYNHYNTSFTERDNHVFGFSMISAYNASHLKFVMIDANGTNRDGDIFDSLWIINNDLDRSQRNWLPSFDRSEAIIADINTVPQGMASYTDLFPISSSNSADDDSDNDDDDGGSNLGLAIALSLIGGIIAGVGATLLISYLQKKQPVMAIEKSIDMSPSQWDEKP